jgi:hypothetical protein
MIYLRPYLKQALFRQFGTPFTYIYSEPLRKMSEIRTAAQIYLAPGDVLISFQHMSGS